MLLILKLCTLAAAANDDAGSHAARAPLLAESLNSTEDVAITAATDLINEAVQQTDFHSPEDVAAGLMAKPDGTPSNLAAWVKFAEDDSASQDRAKILRESPTNRAATVAADGTVNVAAGSVLRSTKVEKEQVLSLWPSGPTTPPTTHTRSKPEFMDVDDPLVLMYDTTELPTEREKGDNEHVVHLLSQLQATGWSYKVVGTGTQWEGWCSKINILVDELRLLNPEQLVVVSDARDVLLNPVKGGKEDFAKRYKETHETNAALDHSPVVIAAEGDCCVAALNLLEEPGRMINATSGERLERSCTSGYGKCLHHGEEFDKKWEEFFKGEAKKRGHAGTMFPYLNAGMIVGRAKDIKRVYEYIQATPEEDDQALLSEVLFAKPDWQDLDYEQKLFGTNRWVAGVDEGCLYDWQENVDGTGSFKNRATGETPHFIHTSGRFWDCYKRLDEKIAKENQKQSKKQAVELTAGSCDPYAPDFMKQGACKCDVHLWWSWHQCSIKSTSFKAKPAVKELRQRTPNV